MNRLSSTFRALLCVSCLFVLSGAGCGPRNQWQPIPPIIELDFQFVTAFGTAGNGPGEFLDPQGLCLDPWGSLYLADTGNDRIQKFDHQGRFLFQFGSFGWKPGQFNKPTDVAMRTSLDFYVVDSQNRRIQIFDVDSDPLAEITNDFGWLAGIAISSYGDIYITDGENNRLIRINPFGRVETDFSGLSLGGESLFNPSGLAIGRKKDVYVCDSGNNRIIVFDEFGGLLFSFGKGILLGPEGISINSKGEVFVADTGGHRVVAFNEKGRCIEKLGAKGAGQGFFQMPRDVAASADFLYVLDSGNSRVQKFKIIRTVK